jgi:DNA-binding XRE family transcriptional regulator
LPYCHRNIVPAQGSNFTKALKAIAVVHSLFAIERGKLKNALATAKKLGIAVDDIYQNNFIIEHF